MTRLEIINKYPTLRLGLKYIMLNNKSNLAPYHNLSHMLTVMKHCYDACEYMHMLDDEDDYIELLLVVALFHDYNHSMGRRDDGFNVAQAKLGLSQFLTDMDIEIPQYTSFMEGLLDATQYPYIIESDKLNIYQQIIRDADLLQMVEPDWISHVILGLCEEMHYPLDALMIGERKFLRGIEFHTFYGRMMRNTHGKRVWDEFKQLEKILK